MCGITASIALSAKCYLNLNGLRVSHSADTIQTNGHHHQGGNSNFNVKHCNTNRDHFQASDLYTRLKASVAVLNHRGPDESGIWINSDESVGLGHCRLSINDLSPSGAQPLTSDDGEIHAVVNGEIYDFDRLRKVCATEHGYEFRGESDSELVIALYKIHGAPNFFQHLRGEFAFVLHDGRDGRNRVIAARDRFGIKPLMWMKLGHRIVLSAEAKAFLPMGWEPEWDIKALGTSTWQLGDRTLFKGVKTLLPGQWMDINNDVVELRNYWEPEYPDKSVEDTRTLDEMVTETRERVIEAVRLRLRADVPIGIYLSGGIDSSFIAGIVTKLVQEENVKLGSQTSPNITCFTVGFPRESGLDESGAAQRTAQRLGLNLHTRILTEETLANAFESTAFHNEQHHFDMNTVAKYALSEMAKEQGMKVVLTGEGADEHFAGYPYSPIEFLREPDLSRPESTLVKHDGIRKLMFNATDNEVRTVYRGIGTNSEGSKLPEWSHLKEINNNMAPDILRVWHARPIMFSPWLQEKLSQYDHCDSFLKAFSEEEKRKVRERWHPLNASLHMWARTGLTHVLLSTLADRVEMAHSVEARTPYLDHHLTEFINNLPPTVKVKPDEELLKKLVAWNEGGGSPGNTAGHGLQGVSEKWILREAAKPFVSEEVYQRKKLPFMAPTRWSRDGPLKKLFTRLLTPEAVENLGFVDYRVVQMAMARAFGEDMESGPFRLLLHVGAWVTLSQKLGVRRVEPSDWYD